MRTVFFALIFLACTTASYAQQAQRLTSFSENTPTEWKQSLTDMPFTLKAKTDEAGKTTLYVTDQAGKTISEMVVKQRIFKDKDQKSYSFISAEILQTSLGLRLLVMEGERNVVPKVEAGTRHTYLLASDGTWQKLKEQNYRERAIAD